MIRLYVYFFLSFNYPFLMFFYLRKRYALYHRVGMFTEAYCIIFYYLQLLTKRFFIGQHNTALFWKEKKRFFRIFNFKLMLILFAFQKKIFSLFVIYLSFKTTCLFPWLAFARIFATIFSVLSRADSIKSLSLLLWLKM